MIPHERSLVEKWKNRPFAILGVNSDRTDTAEGLAKYREKQKEMSVTWRSFRDESTDPKVSDTWRVQGWPTLYFLDHKGVIRHKDLRDDAEMEKALDELITAAEQDAKK
jgi:hypothetical protein